ncbi:hypothetical protein FYJ24_09440 [Actinomycetaceae bacterium WB03_NA08]|uniref:Uncharacterized protein n=1 Tax=Scrofimicrobium canadense TaxID=2652290 RepID=A0A6N7W973_9ACTO|nr:hypothetical protein [Scrofimicrobium canadense]MSS84982.1 hypothetical protein [Scrofimicrobium canadense]
MTTNTPMPRDTAIQKLDQLARWKQEIPDAHANLIGLHSTWQVGGLHGTLAEDVRMPHGLDAVFDDVDSLGAPGIRTETGANEILESLAIMVAGYLQVDVEGWPAHWLHETLWLYPESFWHAWEDWETFTQELSQAHGTVARLCGRSSVTVRLCPQCGGKVKAHMTHDGQATKGTCAGCAASFDLTKEDWDAALIERLRSPKISRTVLVTHTQLKTIWPQLRMGTVRLWVHRGQVSKVDDRYVLADINGRAVVL